MDVDDLIEQLCTMAGMIMEDASVVAIERHAEADRRITAIARAGRQVIALADAAAVIASRRT